MREHALRPMNRRTFLRSGSRRAPVAAPAPVVAPSLVAPPADRPRPERPWRPPPSEHPFEVAPGVFAPAGLPVRWEGAPPRPEAVPEPEGAPLRTTTGLEPYVPSGQVPWNAVRALHLLRRTAIGATTELLDEVLALGPGATVDALVDGVLNQPPIPDPPWADIPFPDWDSPDFEVFVEDNGYWLSDYEWECYTAALGGIGATPMEQAVRAFHERLTHVWHNHFVTQQSVYFWAPFLLRYWRLLRRHALGDFRQAVYDIGLTPAMLIYLNGVDNQAGNPNENYARELLELFTMGLTDVNGNPNYTQTDVEELARALTGWAIDYQGTLEAYLIPEWHDDGQKTILGRTGPWGYDDIVPILFGAKSPEIARFVCRKLYRAFVYDVPDENIVGQMAAQLRANNFQLAPVVRTLLKSAHFFDPATLGARLKSPLDRTFGIRRDIGIPYVREEQGYFWWMMWLTGQMLFEPPNVAGWPGARTWIDTGTLPLRWQFDGWALWDGIEAVHALAMRMAHPYSAQQLARELARFLVGREPDPDEMPTLVELLLNGLPAYEWDPLADGADYRIRALAEHLTRLPEYQLF